MGKARFLYNNLITDEDMITVSSLRIGLVMGALKNGEGSAVLTTSGDYSGSVDKEYIVEIDSIAGGAEVGQATFKWSNGGGSWNASGVTTSAVNILLEKGVYIKWTTGSGDDFVVGDKWYFKAINLFNAGKMITLDRDDRYRSAALESPNTITVDLKSSQEVQAFILFDHNLTSGATITLKGNTANSGWDTPAFSEAVTWNSEKIVHYLSSAQTYRYWRIEITDAGNGDGYTEIGELYLGSYLELTRNYVDGFSRGYSILWNRNETLYGTAKKRFFNKRRMLRYSFNFIPSADVTSLEALLDAITDIDTGKLNAFWFNEDSAYPNNTWIVDISALPEDHRMRGYYDVPLEMTEVMKSV